MRSLVNFDPFKEIENFFDDDWFPTLIPLRRYSIPAVNVSENENEIIVETALPGIDPKKVDITVEDNILTLRSKMEEKKEDRKKQYYRREIRTSGFERSLSLPCKVKPDKADAKYKDGVLKITLPKAEEAKAKRIAIKVGK